MDKSEMNQFIYGAVMMGSLVAGTFFLKFWQKTEDRFFALFASAFYLLAIERCIFLFISAENEVHTWVFICRLLAFLAIGAAVVEKNRQ